MRHVLAAVLLLSSACRNASAPAARELDAGPPRSTRSAPLSDLQFNDGHLQDIADQLAHQARLRGIDTTIGENRIERLLWLESTIGGRSRALNRVNALIGQLTWNDITEWAKVRQAADREFRDRDDALALRVRGMLTRWQRQKSAIAIRFLSSNYTVVYISSVDWERRFHAFVSERPIDAATWGWLLARRYGEVTKQQYGRADAEMAYRFYLEYTGLGNGSEARRLFSVPGTQITAGP